MASTNVFTDVMHERMAHTAQQNRLTLPSVGASGNSGLVALDIGVPHGILDSVRIATANNVVFDVHCLPRL